VGTNGQKAFWCGFCQKIVPLQKRGLEAWDERFTHIDVQHFKKGETVDNWFPIDRDIPKSVLAEEKKDDSEEEKNESDEENWSDKEDMDEDRDSPPHATSPPAQTSIPQTSTTDSLNHGQQTASQTNPIDDTHTRSSAPSQRQEKGNWYCVSPCNMPQSRLLQFLTML